MPRFDSPLARIRTRKSRSVGVVCGHKAQIMLIAGAKFLQIKHKQRLSSMKLHKRIRELLDLQAYCVTHSHITINIPFPTSIIAFAPYHYVLCDFSKYISAGRRRRLIAKECLRREMKYWCQEFLSKEVGNQFPVNWGINFPDIRKQFLVIWGNRFFVTFGNQFPMAKQFL